MALSIPVGDTETHIMLLLPGGGALHATGSLRRRRPTRSAPSLLKVPAAKLVAEALFQKLTPGILYSLPFNKLSVLLPKWWNWATIEPDPSPSRFGSSKIPPNWVGATVATCYVPPRGSAGPRGPGTESGVPVFAPGSTILRGAFAGYLQATTPVTVVPSVFTAGRAVRLSVTSHVMSFGYPTILSMSWTDVYQIVPSRDGPVTFPGVIVATARGAAGPLPRGSYWPDEVAKRFTWATATGAPVHFEAQIDGVRVGTRDGRFNAKYPGSPKLFLGP